MKKILFLLLLSVATYGQTYQNPTFGTVTTKTSPTVTTPAFINTQEATGVNGKIPSTYIEKTENKQNSLTTDGTGVKYSTVDAVNAGLDLKQNATSTAITSTATLTNNGTTFSLSAFTGKIVNNSTVPATITNINFAGASNVTPSYFRTILYVDNTGTLIQFNGGTTDLTAQQTRDNIYVGIVVYVGGSVSVVSLVPNIDYNISNRFDDLTNFIGNINQGNNIGANGANLQINKGAGYTFRRGSNYAINRTVPDVTTDAAATPIPAGVNLVGYRNGSGGWSYSAYSGSINPGLWDNGSGTPVAVANNRFTNQRVYFFNGTNTYVIYLGRTEYATLALAVADAEKPPSIVDPATAPASLVGTVSVAYNATALNNTAQAQFVQGPRFQGGSSTGGASGSQTLQNTYLNSSDPQFITTAGLGAVTFQAGSGLNATTVLETKNDAGTVTAGITGNGAITGLTYNGYTPESNSNKATDFTTVNNTLYPSVQAVKTQLDLKIDKVGDIMSGTLAIGAPSSTSVGFSVNRTTTTLNKHSFEDYSFLNPTVPNAGYGVFDSSTAMGGSVDNDHLISYQARTNYASTGNLGMLNPITDINTNSGMFGFYTAMVHNSAGAINNSAGALINDISGSGVINNNYGIYIRPISRGITNSWSLFSERGKHFIGGDMLLINNNGIAGGSNINLNFGVDNTATNTNYSAQIKALQTATYGASLIFSTFDNVTRSEKMRLTHDGKLLLNNNTDDGSGNTIQVTGSIGATTYTGGAVLTGTPTAPTATAGTTGNQIATLDFVLANSGAASANYSPTLTNITNTSGLSSTNSSYTKIGNIVTVYIRFSITETASLTATTFSVTLPFNRTNSSLVSAIGQAVVSDTGTTGEKAARVSFGSANNSTALISYTTLASFGAVVGSASFQYSTTE